MEDYVFQQDFVFQHMPFFFVIGLLMGIAVYCLPAFIAFRRRHQNRIAILVINIFLGPSVIGWLVALAWALSGEIELKEDVDETTSNEPRPRIPPTLDKEA